MHGGFRPLHGRPRARRARRTGYLPATAAPRPMDLLVADAFTDRPFAGNPAAVAFLGAPAGEAWMQAVAAEMNLSETAFLVPTADPGVYGLRWFTPAVEVALCGHATLAAAHALAETGRLAPGATVHFDTASGRLTATPAPGGAWALDFPALPPAEAPLPDGLADALGTAPVWYGRSAFDALAVLPLAADVRALDASAAGAAALAAGVRGLIVTAPGDDPGAADVVSRFFAPAAGVPEDPVTGSAHCVLGPYWAARLGRDTLACEQASPRGGRLTVRCLPRPAGVAGEPQGRRSHRVTLTGRAVTIWTGRLAPAASAA